MPNLCAGLARALVVGYGTGDELVALARADMETFFDGDPHFQRLARVFAWLAPEPGIGVVTGEPGVGKTSAVRHLCRTLPQQPASVDSWHRRYPIFPAESS
ncbi:MAG: ATP-binding protein [Pseudomonadota bacterium]|nr:ATP-binding protein [Pseudomonadota bacterium]